MNSSVFWPRAEVLKQICKSFGKKNKVAVCPRLYFTIITPFCLMSPASVLTHPPQPDMLKSLCVCLFCVNSLLVVSFLTRAPSSVEIRSSSDRPRNAETEIVERTQRTAVTLHVNGNVSRFEKDDGVDSERWISTDDRRNGWTDTLLSSRLGSLGLSACDVAEQWSHHPLSFCHRLPHIYLSWTNLLVFVWPGLSHGAGHCLYPLTPLSL